MESVRVATAAWLFFTESLYNAMLSAVALVAALAVRYCITFVMMLAVSPTSITAMIILAALVIFGVSFEYFLVSTRASVRLSCPPPALCPRLSTWVAMSSVTVARLTLLFDTSFNSYFSGIVPCMPSEQSMKRSPFSYATSAISTSTVSAAPRALVMMLDCAERRACSSVITFCFTISNTMEWSNVRNTFLPLLSWYMRLSPT